MKKVIFLVSIVGIYCISCNSSKKSISQVSVQDYYKDNPYASKYMGDPNLITPEQAKIYMKAFKKHKYKGLFKGNHLDNAWSTFNPVTLVSLVNDKAKDSIFFLLAAFPKKDKSVSDSERRHPFIIIEWVPKIPMSAMGKGSAEYSATQGQPLFFTPITLCPPPNAGCRIPGGD